MTPSKPKLGLARYSVSLVVDRNDSKMIAQAKVLLEHLVKIQIHENTFADNVIVEPLMSPSQADFNYYETNKKLFAKIAKSADEKNPSVTVLPNQSDPKAS